MSQKTFTARQANGINAFFEKMGVPLAQRSPRRLKPAGYNYAPNGDTCEICGHFIKHVFHLRDVEAGGDLKAGSDCIETYFQVTSDDLVADFKRYAKSAKAAFKDAGKAENLTKLTKARDEIMKLVNLLHTDIPPVIPMLNECITNNYPFTEKRYKWAQDTWKRLNEIRKERGLDKP